MSVDLFYREFEAAFRGARAEILARLEVYREFLTPLHEVSPGRKALDLGCGRGEWLELACKAGFVAHGVDLDAGMLEDCFARGLSAVQGDAVAYLGAQPDNSIAVVSGFHIAEHLPFPVLQEFIEQALRVLEPAGLLILETPNPENIRVSSMTFHMDPTHNKPLPPGLLSFLPRHYGFERAQVLRLQESPALRSASTASLVDVFGGVSPDYAVVAQKPAAPALTALFDNAFNADRGLTLETLAGRFEAGLTSRSDFERLRANFDHLRAENDRLHEELHRLQADTQDWRAQLDQRLEAIGSSTSWRVTAPLRRAGRLVHAARSGALRQRIVDRARLVVLPAALMVHKRPVLRRTMLATIRAVPGLERRLRSLMAVRQRPQGGWERRHSSSHLTPRGQAIYDKLKQLRDH